MARVLSVALVIVQAIFVLLVGVMFNIPVNYISPAFFALVDLSDLNGPARMLLMGRVITNWQSALLIFAALWVYQLGVLAVIIVVGRKVIQKIGDWFR